MKITCMKIHVYSALAKSVVGEEKKETQTQSKRGHLVLSLKNWDMYMYMMYVNMYTCTCKLYT